ncbi:hypothetical protein DFJ74DRAFT_669226 [Hyaloraphidium curvatum]|nr:hypothetical protein DFJ74DRAFT_669226 [Hyaloraphidium curvatum]
MAPAMCCAACDHRVESGGALRGYLVLAPDLRRAVDFRHVVCPPSRNPKCEAASKQIMKRDTATLMDPKQLIKGARCAACDKASADPTREFSCCSRCKQARYCSKDCQVADWPKHKPVCSEIVAMKKDSEAKAGRK